MADPFVYTDAAANLGAKHAHVAVIPTGINERGALFDCLVSQLALPDYFGANWDALDECLNDLSWIDRQSVLLFHEDLPALEDSELRVYLEMLRDAVLGWRRDLDQELVVALPFSARERVARLLVGIEG